jgi:hypothetical protein
VVVILEEVVVDRTTEDLAAWERDEDKVDNFLMDTHS